MDNLLFFLTCIGVLAALLAVAFLCERFLCKDRKKLSSTHYVAYTAVFSAMAGVLMTLEIPLFFAPSFYKLDLSEIPVLICTFYLGPVSGVLSELLKVLLKLLIKGTSSAFVGDFANFVVGCSFVLPASVIYHAKPGKKTALTGMIAGTLILTVFGSAFNAFYLIPKFAELFKMPIDAIIGMGNAVNKSITDISSLIMFAVVPFNLLKGIIDSAVTFLLYKRISPLLHRADRTKAERREKENKPEEIQ